MNGAVPDVISSFGFTRAPVSQFMVMASGVSSITVALLPRQYQSLLTLRWLDVINKKQVWRLVTSQLIVDNPMDVLSNCILIYYFLVLERRFGTSKYMSFILKTWCLTLGIYFAVMKSNLIDDYVPHIEIVPSGLYGPLYASLIQYYCDIPKGENVGPFGLPISRKIFVYLIALQMFLTSSNTMLISTCGILSGIIYKLNVFNIQRFSLPNVINNAFSKFASYFIKSEEKTVSKRALMGATAEIHEDMMFDYMLRRQQQVHWRRNTNSTRNQTNQGYSDVINPSFINFFQPSMPQQPANSATNIDNQLMDPPPLSDEKVRTLVDMGFSRDAVVSALASTNNDIQEATSILLAPS